jgi:hypothetical protein
MIPMNLVEKQAEALERNKEKRAKQNRKNASGPRKQKTTRSPRSIIPGLRGLINDPTTKDKWRVVYIYVLAKLEGWEIELPMPSDIWNSKSDDEESDNKFKFPIRDAYPGLFESTSGQREQPAPQVRQALSVDAD